MKKSAIAILVALAAFFAALTVASAASSAMFVAAPATASQPAASPDPGLLDLARPIYEAVVHGQWWLAAAAALVLGVALTRRYLAPKVPFLGTDIGGAILVLAGAFGAALTTALMAGGAIMSAHLAWVALTVAVAAAGGYSLLNKLLNPLEAMAPAWARPVFRLVTWIFDEVSGTGGPDAADVAAAKTAGQAAVDARPPTGTSGAIGKPPTEVP